VYKAVFISSEQFWSIKPEVELPLQPERLRRTFELLCAYSAFEAPNVKLVAPRQATNEELALFHTRDYIELVERLSVGEPIPQAWHHGLNTPDNPTYQGMREAEGLKVGSSLLAAELLWRGDCQVAFGYGGGLHHSRPSEASGFCVFNDAAIAIQWLVDRGLRIAYVDIDAHHGDGVQWAFYASDRVLTISLHQDGRTLFPGTGAVEEIGQKSGEGYSVNVPLPPGTGDITYLWAFNEVVPPLLERFQADLLVTQIGVDAHYSDPLADLALTTKGYQAIWTVMGKTTSPWLALGGGGYNLDVVPRAWTIAFGIMSEQSFPNRLPATYSDRYGGEFLHDVVPAKIESPRIREQVERTVQRVKQLHPRFY
jgi:acetoin utilization protein AcuC